MSDNAAFKELDVAFDSIIDEIENPDKPHEEVMIFRNLHGEKTEYADYAKVVHTVVVRVSDDGMTAAINVVSTAEKRRRYTIADLNRAIHSKKIVRFRRKKTLKGCKNILTPILTVLFGLKWLI